jgi:hypothetical protein
LTIPLAIDYGGVLLMENVNEGLSRVRLVLMGYKPSRNMMLSLCTRTHHFTNSKRSSDSKDEHHGETIACSSDRMNNYFFGSLK